MKIYICKYLTTLPDFSVYSRTPTLFTITLSVGQNTVLHCSHCSTLLGQSMLSSLLDNWYCLYYTINSFWVQEIHCRISFRWGFCNLQPKKVSVNFIIPPKDRLVFTTRAYFILPAIPIIVSNCAYCYSCIFQRQCCFCSWSSLVCLDTACVDIVQ